MDKVKAAVWEKTLAGTAVAGCTVENLIDFGKSAAVFRASRGGETVALKIFDDELIERYGDKTQLARIDRELTLVGKSHPNMVEILDGGFDAQTGNHFIVMRYLPGPSLEKCLPEIPEANVAGLIEQLASVCEYLESLSLVHRDIKPANIVVLDDFSRLVLLDFGVLKPVGEIGVTDANGIQSFVGTLQYSSPEFLLRNEEDTIEGWRALSIYQIGGVLHDLIMRKPLFEDYTNPYARLVMAVQNDMPSIGSTTLPSYLVEACKASLVKNPLTRIELVDWQSFSPPVKTSAGAAARERVTRRSVVNQATAIVEAPSATATPDLVDVVIDLIKVEARRIRNANTAAFPPLTVARQPRAGRTVTIALRKAPQQGLPDGLTIALDVEVVDEAAQAISLSVVAWRGDSAQRPAKSSNAGTFMGVFVPATVSGLLENVMYMAVDQAQTVNADCELNLCGVEAA
ncbi:MULTISPECIES: protein kinase domain-containing protein [Sphingobium]|uniref:protein kinase domain-containing protein n=1 Tax=Sphingobium TaxID=165695 RepID=UPI0015EB7750|nr:MULTISPECIES: protein kinase [Sphingobium]MCW2362459.1 serine/threonine protein kinase [Sphingobium sp. B10D3B]MCW2400861.1 serine/threonine protein kinase [Sphingobium sp. B10D7B]MCW2407840.1 serine/threonine protein kinase [Sphingobium xanthum]